jgi:hypothetical protein
MSNDGRIHRLAHWFRQRAAYLRAEPFIEGSRTIRTVETIERQEHTVLIGRLPAGQFDSCPMCGRKLAPEPEDRPPPLQLE